MFLGTGQRCRGGYKNLSAVVNIMLTLIPKSEGVTNHHYTKYLLLCISISMKVILLEGQWTIIV